MRRRAASVKEASSSQSPQSMADTRSRRVSLPSAGPKSTVPKPVQATPCLTESSDFVGWDVGRRLSARWKSAQIGGFKPKQSAR